MRRTSPQGAARTITHLRSIYDYTAPFMIVNMMIQYAQAPFLVAVP
jgi:hypothetical protein